jgi:hypothetical protein
MNVKKIPLRLGKETFGEKKLVAAFQEAFAPYFAKEANGKPLGFLSPLKIHVGTNGKFSSVANQ